MNRIAIKSMTLREQAFRFPSPIGTTQEVKAGTTGDGSQIAIYWWPDFQLVEVCVGAESFVNHVSSCRMDMGAHIEDLIKVPAVEQTRTTKR